MALFMASASLAMKEVRISLTTLVDIACRAIGANAPENRVSLSGHLVEQVYAGFW